MDEWIARLLADAHALQEALAATAAPSSSAVPAVPVIISISLDERPIAGQAASAHVRVLNGGGTTLVGTELVAEIAGQAVGSGAMPQVGPGELLTVSLIHTPPTAGVSILRLGLTGANRYDLRTIAVDVGLPSPPATATPVPARPGATQVLGAATPVSTPTMLAIDAAQSPATPTSIAWGPIASPPKRSWIRQRLDIAEQATGLPIAVVGLGVGVVVLAAATGGIVLLVRARRSS